MKSLVLSLLALLFLGCERYAPEAVSPEAAVLSDSEAFIAYAARVAADTSLDLPETNVYEIVVPQGRMVVRLYDETPVHRDNFKKLVAEGLYDSTLFHRVIDGFMIQGGDPGSRDADPYNDGSGGPGYTLPAEIEPGLIHKKGALAAARQGDAMNPERRSSGSQFYIVQGTPHADSTLDEIELMLRQRIPDSAFAFSEAARETYASKGGAPFLDAQYTIFGELIEGVAVLDSVAGAPTPQRTGRLAPPPLADRPLDPIPMTIRPLSGYASERPAEAGTGR